MRIKPTPTALRRVIIASTSSVPGAILCVGLSVTHVTLTTTLRDLCNCYSHLTNEEMEEQRG